jgi:hypothetical protein
MTANYDTAEGIAQYLERGLVGFHDLCSARSEAGYDRREHLHDFLIMGKWYADSCGNMMRLKQPVSIGSALVLAREEWSPDIEFSASIGTALPPAEAVCALCKHGWTLDDCYDCYVIHKDGTRDLEPYVGKTIRKVKPLLNELPLREVLLYTGPGNKNLRNDRFIDLRHDLCDYGSNKGKPFDWPRNERGWVNIDDNYVVQPGDQLSVSIWTYYHHGCHRDKQRADYRSFFTEVFDRAGFVGFSLSEVPNEYCPCEKCGPWFVVDLTPMESRAVRGVADVVKIGWRKNVINIEWEHMLGAVPPDLFAGEEVTKWATGIHAWGKEKAIEYLTKLREARVT